MKNLKQYSLSLLASGTGNMQNGDGKTTILTVPTTLPDGTALTGCIVTHVIVRNPSASLAGGSNFAFGDGANADTWKTSVDLSGMTGTDDYMVIDTNNAVIAAVFNAGDTFGLKPTTGATADATATIEVFGYYF